eukprot:4492902-Amphidinium_carterae.1
MGNLKDDLTYKQRWLVPANAAEGFKTLAFQKLSTKLSTEASNKAVPDSYRLSIHPFSITKGVC